MGLGGSWALRGPPRWKWGVPACAPCPVGAPPEGFEFCGRKDMTQWRQGCRLWRIPPSMHLYGL